MRRKIVAGNWKMNLDHKEGKIVSGRIVDLLKEIETSCEVILIPPFTTIPAVADVIAGTGIGLGAQDLWYEGNGAFTGEISTAMLSSLGCGYVLVGHSERRHIIGEKGPLLSKKLRAALGGSLSPIYCVGELLKEREAGKARDVVSRQVEEVLSGLRDDEIARIVVAYEPVWAIGTGKTATPEDASSMHALIRGLLAEMFDQEAAEEVPILYGGSVKPGNAADLLGRENIDGALVGGASLDPSSFLGIISAA